MREFYAKPGTSPSNNIASDCPGGTLSVASVSRVNFIGDFPTLGTPWGAPAYQFVRDMPRSDL